METQIVSYLTTEGIIFLGFAWGIVISFTVYCLYKVLKGKKEN